MSIENLVLGLSGKPRVGKTTVCNYLVEQYGFNHFEFSDLVKADVARMVGLFGVSLANYEKEEYLLMLQGWGQFARRALGSDFWTKRMKKQLVWPAVVGGVRYPDEIEWIHDMGGEVWRIQSDRGGNNDKAATENQLNGSEVQFDKLIVNNGSFEDLYDVLESGIAKFR